MQLLHNAAPSLFVPTADTFVEELRVESRLKSEVVNRIECCCDHHVVSRDETAGGLSILESTHRDDGKLMHTERGVRHIAAETHLTDEVKHMTE